MKFEVSDRMSKMKGSAIREIFKLAGDPDCISLAGGNPAPELFPNDELAEIAADVLKNEPVLSLQYGVTEGYLPLRNKIREMLKARENIGREFDETIVVSGGQQGIELAAKCLINEGDAVVVEEPSFIGALNAFRSYNAELIGVPLMSDGMDIDVLKEKLKLAKRTKLMYVIPSFQNPSGYTATLEKRKLIYEIALKNNIIIIEDNPYGELAFEGKKLPAIKSMDTEGIVIYCGSFSKILAPGLRVGFVCGHRDIISKLVVAKQISDVHTPMLTQLMVYNYLQKYDLDAAVAKMRALYKEKCGIMVESIEKYFPKEVKHSSPDGGLFVWCDMGEGYDAAAVAKEIVKDNVVFVPGSTFMVDMDAPCSCFRLNYSSMSSEKIVKGIELLGNALHRIMNK